jgi:hypothetical protein
MATAEKAPPCSACGGDVLCWPDEGPAYCPECCPDHDYEYVRAERRHMCATCSAEPPEDWYDRD